MLLLFVFLVFLCIYLFINNFTKIKDYIEWWKQISKLPTLAGKRFFIGHAGLVVGLSNEASWKLAREWYKTASPLHTIYLGPSLIFVVLLEPDEIEAVISPMQNLEKASTYSFLHDWLEDGLLTSHGNDWQKRRKFLTPAFHFSILKGFVDIFTRETSKMIEEIENKYLDEPVNIQPIISTFTLVSINETSMGIKLDINSTEGQSYKNAIYRMGDIIYERVLRPWLHYKLIFNMTSDGKLEKKLIKVLHNFTDKIIEKRAENFKIFDDRDDDRFNGKGRKRPLMDILLNVKFKENAIDEKGIREEINTFMFEGHDTTTMSLLYTCMLLACNKEIQMIDQTMKIKSFLAKNMSHPAEKAYDLSLPKIRTTILPRKRDEVHQEIIQILGSDLSKEPTYADLQDMDLMERCIKESLRLYPTVAIIGRKLSDNVQTKYGIIPKGSVCFIHIYDLHRNPKFWPNPTKFDPSRHLPENSRGRHPFAYIPFSAGPRNCIGQRFAMLEMKAALCGLIRKFILEPVDTPDTLVMTQDMVLRPKNGLQVKFTLRN